MACMHVLTTPIWRKILVTLYLITEQIWAQITIIVCVGQVYSIFVHPFTYANI